MSKRFKVEYTISVTLDESDAHEAGQSATDVLNQLLGAINQPYYPHQDKNVWIDFSSNNYITDDDDSVFSDTGELVYDGRD